MKKLRQQIKTVFLVNVIYRAAINKKRAAILSEIKINSVINQNKFTVIYIGRNKMIPEFSEATP